MDILIFCIFGILFFVVIVLVAVFLIRWVLRIDAIVQLQKEAVSELKTLNSKIKSARPVKEEIGGRENE